MLRFALDTNVILGAFDRRETACRALLEAGRAGKVVLALSLTVDQELGGTTFTADDLWAYAIQLPRLPRPSSRLGQARLGEWVLGYGGLGGELVGTKGDRSGSHAHRDEEQLEGADVWKADAFVTSEANLLRRGEILGVRILTPAAALELVAGQVAS